MYTMEYYSVIIRNEIMVFAATCMQCEIIILCEVSQTKTNIIWYDLYMEYKIWHKWTCLQNRNRVTDIENSGFQGQEGREWDGLGIWGM